MTDLHGVARTLRLTLRARADEHQRPDRLFADPLALAWFKALPADSAWDSWYGPAFQTGAALRAHACDRLVQTFVAAHPEALVVELGAGLSTRAARLGLQRLRWVELDLPEVIAVRRRLEQETPQHTFLAASLAEQEWLDQLPPSEPTQTLFVAEGVLPFLDPALVHQLCGALCARQAGASFLFDVAGAEYSPAVRKLFAREGAPLRWLVGDLEELAALGLAVTAIDEYLQYDLGRWHSLGIDPTGLTPRAGGVLVQAVIRG